jgi:hypothetical protein
MKRSFLLLLIFPILGCATESEIRDHKQYTKSPTSDSYIQGDGYKLWYDNAFFIEFRRAEKGSIEWETVQKSIGNAQLDRAFIGNKTALFAAILKFKQKIQHDDLLRAAKKSSSLTIIESDQRMVNNKLALYMRSVKKENNFKSIVSTYLINADSGSRLFTIVCSEDDYRQYKTMILKTLNGIEVD